MLPKSFIIFTIVYIVIILVSAIIAYELEKQRLAQEGKQIDVVDFLNNYTTITPRFFFIGLVFGMAFGMMDNLSLFFGIEGLGDYLRDNYGMDEFQVAGLSNVYSGTLGITLATFAALISKYVFPDVDQDKLPVWINGLGFMLGGLVGIYVPTLFSKIYWSIKGRNAT